VAEATARRERKACPPGRTLVRERVCSCPFDLPSAAGQVPGVREGQPAKAKPPARSKIPRALSRVANGPRRPTRGEEVHLAATGQPRLRCLRLQTRLAPCDADGGRRTSARDGHRRRADGIESPPFDLSGLSRLPLNGFTYYWTLSSKFFSTFPHGTCSLSVSWSYLALDGVYHPLGAPLSRNTTLRRAPPGSGRGLYGPGTLCGLWPRSRETWTRGRHPARRNLPHTTSPCASPRGIPCWALPCSLAATWGILVSFFSSAY